MRLRVPLKKSVRSWTTFGIRVEPPTRTTSWTWFFDIFESRRTFSTGSICFAEEKSKGGEEWREPLSWLGALLLLAELTVPRKRSMLSSSKRARVIDEKKSTPSKSESISIEVWVDEERVRFARSQAVRRRRMARGLPVMSFLCCASGKRRGEGQGG